MRSLDRKRRTTGGSTRGSTKHGAAARRFQLARTEPCEAAYPSCCCSSCHLCRDCHARPVQTMTAGEPAWTPARRSSPPAWHPAAALGPLHAQGGRQRAEWACLNKRAMSTYAGTQYMDAGCECKVQARAPCRGPLCPSLRRTRRLARGGVRRPLLIQPLLDGLHLPAQRLQQLALAGLQQGRHAGSASSHAHRAARLQSRSAALGSSARQHLQQLAVTCLWQSRSAGGGPADSVRAGQAGSSSGWPQQPCSPTLPWCSAALLAWHGAAVLARPGAAVQPSPSHTCRSSTNRSFASWSASSRPSAASARLAAASSCCRRL